AETSDVPDAQASALAARAECFILRFGVAEGEGDRERCERLHAAAVADQRRAIELSRPRSVAHARHSITLAWMTTMPVVWAGLDRAEDADLDTAIGTVRRALRRLWLRAPYAQRAAGYLPLADMLALRAQRDPPRPLAGL